MSCVSYYHLPVANRVPFELWSMISSEFSVKELAKYCGISRALFEISMEKLYCGLKVCSSDWPWCERFEEALSNPIVASRIRNLRLDMRSALHMTRPEVHEEHCRRRGKDAVRYSDEDMFRDIINGFECIQTLSLCSCQVQRDCLKTPFLAQTSRLAKAFVGLLPKLKILNLQVHPETFIELVESSIGTSPSTVLQLQEISISIDSSLYNSSARFSQALTKLISQVSHSLTSLKVVAPCDNVHLPNVFFPFLGRTSFPRLSKVWLALHTRPHYASMPNLSGVNLFLRNHAAQLRELHLTFFQRGMLTLAGPSLLQWYQACFQDIPTSASLTNLWLGSCHPDEVVPLYTSVLGPVYSSVSSLVCVRAQLEHEQIESLLSLPSCSQLKSLVLYVKGVLTRKLAELVAEKCPELEQLSIRYDRNTYRQEALFQDVFKSQPWRPLEEEDDMTDVWAHKVFLIWPQATYMKLARASRVQYVNQLTPADMQVYGYTCETCSKPEEEESTKRNQCVVQ
ncbi:hypothetical protein M378DRAFT_195897 [Amanita muscaria Koide BX008]|uniref:F-box domain-containing protein n=1 Tax=Amanita muscaria (strain Koide BX008) TaxID=946122 RepID=A0A0C2X4B2_AMAMK|nr:hypothetical protein M378DRAFT_195897 [Amanita muscaria Koide BX008]